MPLIKGSSREAVSENIRRERDAGKPQRQSIAIALDVARRSKRAAGGANASPPWYVRNEAHGMLHTGPIVSTVPGRTDHHAMSVPSGSFVLPADHVSALGQGNTQAGMAIVNHMFSSGPYGTALPKMARGRGAPGAKFAKGGPVGKPVPIMASGGEIVLSPEQVAKIGNGDIDRGHKILDAWIVQTRKKHIKTLRGLPGPAKS